MCKTDRLILAGLLGAAMMVGITRANAEEGRKPNVIIIFTDDQGYQDLGCFGSPNIKTPNIDRMAEEGMRFTDFYSGASVCTPSRAALLTGCYPERVGNLGVLFPNRTQGLNPEETTIARMLKRKGYATACVGKWHLGHHKAFLPTSHGFDAYYGIPYSNDMGIDKSMALADKVVWRKGITEETFRKGKGGGPPLMRDTKVIECPADQNTLTKRYTEEAVKFIEANKDNPFFLYLPHTMPHIPLYATPEFEGRSDAGLYGDCIEEIDWSVGRILETLRRLGIDKNTFVAYSSDNGPWKLKGNATDKVKGNKNRKIGGSALPLKGYKFSKWEGGMRVPTVMWWPGRIPAGTECREITGTIDLLPTIAAISGAELPEKKIDGKSIVPLLEGRENASTPHDAYFYRTAAVRSGNWKLINGGLYDLSKDISESNNVAKDNPEVVARLKALLTAHKAELNQNRRPAGQVGNPARRSASVKKLTDWSKVKVGDVLSSDQAPDVVKRPFKITGTIDTKADAERAASTGSGQVVIAHGGTVVGYSVYLAGGNLVFAVSTGQNHLERVHVPVRSGKLSFAAGLDKEGRLFVQTGDGDPVRSQSGKHWITKRPMEPLSVGFDDAHPVDPKAPKGRFKGTLVGVRVE
jgi:arylsulfatase A